MTDYRTLLAEAGFEVAEKPYTSTVHYMRRPPAGQAWDLKDTDGRQYSIDLATGRWTLWGKGVWRPFEEMLASAALATEVPRVRSRELSAAPDEAWLEQCRRAGFLVDDQPCGTPDLGNRFATHHGVRYLICSQPRSIVGPDFEPHTLAEFAPPAPPVKPFVERQPVAVSGCTQQTGLFG